MAEAARALDRVARAEPVSTRRWPIGAARTGMQLASGPPLIRWTLARSARALIESPHECVADICIEWQYLWSLYERTTKIDTIKCLTDQGDGQEEGQDADRDPNRHEVRRVRLHVEGSGSGTTRRMSPMDYVIGGMDRGFKLKLYHALRTMDDAGSCQGHNERFATTTVNRSQAATRPRLIAPITVGVGAAAIRTGLRLIS